jgi:hypothetical protein
MRKRNLAVAPRSQAGWRRPHRETVLGTPMLLIFSNLMNNLIRYSELLFSRSSGKMDWETALYALAWIVGFIVFLLRFGKLYRD